VAQVTAPHPLAVLAGAALDAVFRDPPNAVHPVAAIGPLAGALERHVPGEPAARRRYGLVAAIALPAAAAAAAAVIERAPRSSAVRASVGVTLFMLTTSRRTLFERVAEVERALESAELDAARALLARHLVSRDTSTLDEAGVAAATIESSAENLSDGVVAPLLAFVIGGAPLAWAYRTSNTLDALWGYRNERYVDLGRAAARIDDAWNLVPARLTALAICAAASITDRRGRAALVVWRRDRGLTASPNAGHPMAAMAGALGVELAKEGHYRLGGGGRRAGPSDIAQARRIAAVAVNLIIAAYLLAASYRWCRR
jgi:adenosylcobinamide-phosphate synthase